jgi:four helix bundle protein
MKLRILDDIVDSVGVIHQLARLIARHDPDLSKQMRRAINSVGLNAGESLAARGGNRTVRIESAMTSGREVILALRIAGAAGYLDADRVAREIDTIDRLVATLYKLAYLPGGRAAGHPRTKE